MTDTSRRHRLQAEIEELTPKLRSLAKAFCRNPTEADDLAREAVAITLASLDQLPEDVVLEAWIFATMYGSFRRKYGI